MGQMCVHVLMGYNVSGQNSMHLYNRGYAITCPHMTTIYNGMFKICRTKTKGQLNHLLVLRLIRFDPNRYTTIKTGTTVNRHVAGKSVCRYLVPGGKSPEQLLWHAGAN